MIFVYKKWEEICRKLKEKGLQSIIAKIPVFNRLMSRYYYLSKKI